MLHTVSRRLRHALLMILCLGLFGLPGAQAADPFTPTSDFTDNGDGTVTHKLTGLTWMRCAMGQSWTGSTCSGDASDHDWTQASALTSTFAGKSDWRVPSPWELATIVDYASAGPVINSTIFSDTPGWTFWSGSPGAYYSGNSWGVSFGSGVVNGSFFTMGHNAYVRLVRGGQSFGSVQIFGNLTTPATDFTVHGDGTVTHKKTGLTWKRCAEGQVWSAFSCIGTARSFTHDQAVALPGSVAGNAGWRVPNVQELQSIIEYGILADIYTATLSPTINRTIFPDTPGSNFWSSSHNAGDSSKAWWVDFNSGSASYSDRSKSHHVRLVRGIQSPAGINTSASYNAYLAAFVPSMNAFFVHNGTHWSQWMGGEMVTFASGVAEWSRDARGLIALYEASTMMPEGTVGYVGYGSSTNEMMSGGRYNVIGMYICSCRASPCTGSNRVCSFR